MALNVGLWKYIKAAFHARFLGMFFSPAWAILALFGFLGIVANPGFLFIGAGLEMAYLFTVATHPRFQRYVRLQLRSIDAIADSAYWKERIEGLLEQLGKDEGQRFYDLKKACDSILDFYALHLLLDETIIEQHRRSLNKLLWIFLQLLVTRRAIGKLLEAADYPLSRKKFEAQIADLESQIQKAGISEELRKSFESKREIVTLRLRTLTEAEQKRTYTEAELDRIEQQVQLIREQAVVSRDSQGVASRIDLVSSSLNQTSDWIKQQEGILGSLEDISATSPSILSSRKTKQGEHQ